ncbi:hypothetical protein KFU94_61055 [Chloroflexi bacterium TSY]|nr:hypothetical protein [Chloroflexi bacterium TSY]
MDLLSLGVVAYILFTGKQPFKADNPLALLHQIVYEQPPSARQFNKLIPPGVGYALQRVLNKEPQNRFETAGQFVEALERGKEQIPFETAFSRRSIPLTVQKRISKTSAKPPSKTPQILVRHKESQWIRTMTLVLLAAMTTIGVSFSTLFLLDSDLRNRIIFAQSGTTAQESSNSTALIESSSSASGPNSTTGYIQSTQPVPLTPFIDQQKKFQLYVPAEWQQLIGMDFVRFDDPHENARLFVEQLTNNSPDQTPREAIWNYLETRDDLYQKLTFIEQSTRNIDDTVAYEQKFEGIWRETPVYLQLTIIDDQDLFYMIGRIVAIDKHRLLEPVLNMVVESFIITHQENSVIDTAFVPFTSAGLSDEVQTDSTSEFPTSTVTIPKQIPTSTPIPQRTVPPASTPSGPISFISTPPPTKDEALQIGQIQLISPTDNTLGNGHQFFEWQTSFTPTQGQGFELIFWRDFEDPIVNGFGLAAPTKETQILVDLDALDDVLGDLLEPGSYLWGILLVNEDPYIRLKLLEGGRTYQFTRDRSGSSQNPASGE